MSKITLHEPDKKWAVAFQHLKDILLEQTNGSIIAIEHIGSTAIKDMPAKNIVDIQCAVDDFEQVANIGKLLETIGFQIIETIRQDHVPFQPADYFHPDWEKRFFKGSFNNQAFNIHIRKLNSKNWLFALAFRDQLSDNMQLHTAYRQCKERLSKAGVSGEDYCLIKDCFIDLMSLQFIE